MKLRHIFLFIVLVRVTLSADALYNYDSPFEWNSPEIMAQGGSFTAIASGFNSLMTNPAGLSMGRNYTYTETVDERGGRVVEKKEKGEITLLGILPSATINPFTLYEDSSGKNFSDFILDRSSSDGLGAELQLGAGYIGYGFGFALISLLDLDFPLAEDTTSVIGDVTFTSSFVGGYAYRFEIGSVGLSLGADLRPMWRIKAIDIDMDTLLNITSGEEVDYSSIDVLTGFAIGFDAGLIFDWNMFAFGLSFRDIGNTRYMYQLSNGEDILNDAFNGSDYDGLDYITPMTMRLGLAVHPDLGSFAKIIDPKIHVEYVATLIDYDLVSSFEEESFLTNFNGGIELKLLQFLALRGGLSSGSLSAGFGLDLYIAEINAAVYSQEIRSHSGSSQQMGSSVELAFRF